MLLLATNGRRNEKVCETFGGLAENAYLRSVNK